MMRYPEEYDTAVKRVSAEAHLVRLSQHPIFVITRTELVTYNDQEQFQQRISCTYTP